MKMQKKGTVAEWVFCDNPMIIIPKNYFIEFFDS